MSTPQEIFGLMQDYTRFDKMFIDAVKENNTSKCIDIQLQMSKIRERLAALGEIAKPLQNE